MMNKKYILAVITVVFAGCSWDSELYKHFVDEKGSGKRPVFCPGDKNEDLSELSEISMRCESCDNGIYTIKRENCLSKEKCGDDKYLTNKQKEILSLAFEYNACPQKSEYLNFSYLCRGDTCIDETLECACKMENAEISQCINANPNDCEIVKCSTDYHLKDNKCIKDSVKECGDALENCETYAGYVPGGWECYDGKCMANKCDTGYHVYNEKNLPCEIDSVENCGAHGKQCELKPGASMMLCHNQKCKIAGCKDFEMDMEDNTVPNKDKGEIYGFHPSRYGDECIRNSTKECGSFNYSCEVLLGWNASECTNDFYCTAKKCDDGYHKYEQNGITICEADTNMHCGKHGMECKGEEPFCGRKCKNNNIICDENSKVAGCVSGCPEGTVACGLSCVDILTDINNCGKCTNSCLKDNSERAICINGDCSIESCGLGYHLEDGLCVKDSFEHCGEYGKSCDLPHANSECVYGKCVITSCKPDYDDCDEIIDNGCELNLKELHMASCHSCSVGYGDCDHSIIDGNIQILPNINHNGCETDLRSNNLILKNNECVCDDKKVYCDQDHNYRHMNWGYVCDKYKQFGQIDVNNVNVPYCVDLIKMGLEDTLHCNWSPVGKFYECGTTLINKFEVPLCLRLQDWINTQYCDTYCNSKNHSNDDYEIIGGTYYKRNQCSAGQYCYMKTDSHDRYTVHCTD